MNQELPYDLTVVTVCRNALPFLPRCIASVQPLYQSSLKVEHLIVDGASSDGSVSYLWCQHHAGRISRYISEPDAGIYHAMNKAIHLARGKVLVFINADDEICAGAVSACCDPLLKGDAQYSVASALCIDGEKQRVLHPRPEDTLWRQPYCHQTMYCRRDLLIRMGGFDADSFPIGADTDLMRRLYVERIPSAIVPVVAAHFYTGGASSSSATCHDVYRLMLKFTDACRNEILHEPRLVCKVVKHMRRYANKKLMHESHSRLSQSDISHLARFVRSVVSPLSPSQRFVLQCRLRLQVAWYAALGVCRTGRKRQSAHLNRQISGLFASCI